MPYHLTCKRNKCFVVGPRGNRHSKKRLPRKRAVSQMRALYAVEHGYKLTRRRR